MSCGGRRPFLPWQKRSLLIPRLAFVLILAVPHSCALAGSPAIPGPIIADLARLDAYVEAVGVARLQDNPLQQAVPAAASAPAGEEMPAVLLRGLFELAIGFYQIALSSQDTPVCNFTPSCSHYAKEAIQAHGPVVGVLLASDRIQRCLGAARKNYPVDKATGLCADPVVSAEDSGESPAKEVEP